MRSARGAIGCFALAVLSIPVATASAANYSLTPHIALSEEYNDNVHASRDNEQTDFITTAQAGVALKYKAPFWDWDAAYRLSYHYYANGSDDDYFQNWLAAGVQTRLIENFLYLDARDSYDQISLASNRNQGTTTDQTNRNYFTVSPYIKFKPVPTLELKTGYQYVNRHYSGDSGLDYQEHQAFFNAAKELLPKWDLLVDIDYAHVIPESAENHDRLTPTLGVRTYYFTDSFILARGGLSWFVFENGKERVTPFWDLQLTYNPKPWSASLRTWVAYNQDALYSSSEDQAVAGWLKREYSRSTLQLTASYTNTRDVEENSTLSEVSRLNLRGTWLFSKELTGHVDLGLAKSLAFDEEADSYYGDTPYEINVGTGLSYAVEDGLKASLAYQYTNYRRNLNSSADSITVNRVIVAVSKSF
jgi:hypothetical protein